MAKQETNTNRECVVLCPHCHESITAHWHYGFYIGWRLPDDECPHCRQTVKLPKTIKTLLCPHCQTQVEELEDGHCPNCGKEVFRQNDVIKVTCPTCGIVNVIARVPKGKVICSSCKEEIPERVVNAYKAVESEEPVLITLPNMQELSSKANNIVWRLPRVEFPYKSRVIVSQGTYGLLLQNGQCQYPMTPGDYPLADTNLTKEEKFDEAQNGTSIVFRTDIYCVAASLPTFNYGLFTSEIKDQTTGLISTVGCGASIDLVVDDAKAFADMTGFRELSKMDLFACENPEKTGILVSILRGRTSEALTRIVTDLNNKRVPFTELQLHVNDIQDEIRKELADKLAPSGLGVRNFTLVVQDGFKIQQSTASKAIENKAQIARLINTRFRWDAGSIRVCMNELQSSYADFNFSGGVSFVTDDGVFYDNPGIRALLNQTLEVSAMDVSRVVMDDLFLPMLRTQLAAVAQSVVLEHEGDLRALPSLTDELEKALIPSLDRKLIPYGLNIRALDINQPTIVASAFQKDTPSLRESKENIIAWVERPLTWQVDNVRVHVKNQPEYNAHVSFTGTCSFRVPDVEAYFKLSEVKGYLRRVSVLNPDDISQDYARKITDNFKTHLQNATQEIINAFDADLRFLDNFRANIVAYLSTVVSDLVRGWGLTIPAGSLNITGVQVDPGPILTANISCLEGKAQTAIELEVHRTEADKVVETQRIDSAAQVTMSEIETERMRGVIDSAKAKAGLLSDLADTRTEEAIKAKARQDRIRVYEYELSRANARRAHSDDLSDLRDEAEIEALRDQLTEEQKVRDFNTLFNDFTRRKAMDEAALQKRLDEEEKLQSAEIRRRKTWITANNEAENLTVEQKEQLARRAAEQDRILSGIRNQTKLDDEGFRKALHGIMHEIDQSDLDWRKKLDEYNRLAHQLGFNDDLSEKIRMEKFNTEAARNASDTEAYTQQQKAGTFTVWENAKDAARAQAGQTGVALNSMQADLAERINRWAEDRNERTTGAAFDRGQRRELAEFEQSMRERQESVNQEIALLQADQAFEKAKIDHEEKISELNADLIKLRLTLDYYRQKDAQQYGTERARIEAEKAAREAEQIFNIEHEAALAEERKLQLEQRQKADDALADRAMELYRQATEYTKALNDAELAYKTHLDDNDVRRNGQNTDVARAQAKSGDIAQAVSDARREIVDTLNNKAAAEVSNRLSSLESAILNGKNAPATNPDSDNDPMNILKSIATGIEQTSTTIPGFTMPDSSALSKLNESVVGLGTKIDSLTNKVDQRRCPNCNTPLPHGAQFCPSCGKGLNPATAAPIFAAGATKICPRCNHSISAIYTECPYCRTRI